MNILGLAESFETMKRPGPTVTLFDSLYLGKYNRYGRKISTQYLFKSLFCFLQIWDRYLRQLGQYALFGNVVISVIFRSFFFHHNFRLEG